MGKKGIETKEYIKKKAYLLFAMKGFKDVTMKDVCEATGLSRGGLYRHFESTDQIFSEIVSLFLDRQNNDLKEKIAKKISAVDILNEILEQYKLEMIDTENCLSMAIYEYFSRKEIKESDSTLYNQYMESFHSWDMLIQYGISRGEFLNVDARSVFELIVFSYQGVRMYSQLMHIGEDIPERIMEQIKQILIT